MSIFGKKEEVEKPKTEEVKKIETKAKKVHTKYPDAARVFDERRQLVRTYTEKEHGKDFLILAESFVEAQAKKYKRSYTIA